MTWNKINLNTGEQYSPKDKKLAFEENVFGFTKDSNLLVGWNKAGSFICFFIDYHCLHCYTMQYTIEAIYF